MVLNNMYKNKYNTVQSRYVLDMMFGKSSGFLLIAFITYAYAKCIIQCISINSKFFYINKLPMAWYIFSGYKYIKSDLFKYIILLDDDYFMHAMIQFYMILGRLPIYANVVSLWLYPMMNFIFRPIICSNFLLQI